MCKKKLKSSTPNFKGVDKEPKQAAKLSQIQGTAQPLAPPLGHRPPPLGHRPPLGHKPSLLQTPSRGLILGLGRVGQGGNVFKEQTEEQNNEDVGRDIDPQGCEKGTEEVSKKESKHETKKMKGKLVVRSLNPRTKPLEPSMKSRHKKKRVGKMKESIMPVTRFELVTIRV